MNELFSAIERWLAITFPAGTVVPPWHVDRRTNCTIYSGQFCLFDPSGKLLRQIPGRIVEWPGLPSDTYIFDPPLAVRRHPHGSCFQLLAPNHAWFRLHWEKPPKDFDASRAYIEELLHDALCGRQ